MKMELAGDRVLYATVRRELAHSSEFSSSFHDQVF